MKNEAWKSALGAGMFAGVDFLSPVLFYSDLVCQLWLVSCMLVLFWNFGPCLPCFVSVVLIGILGCDSLRNSRFPATVPLVQ